MSEEKDKEILISKYTSDSRLSTIVRQKSQSIRNNFDPKEHKCKDYKSYYLKRVFENYLSWEKDEFLLVGEVQSVGDPELCLEVSNNKLVTYSCRPHLTNAMDSHTMGFTKNRNIRLGNKESDCWDAADHGDKTVVIAYPCHLRSATEGTTLDTQWFEYRNSTQQIVHVPTNRCMTVEDAKTVWLVRCGINDAKQKWTVKNCAWF